MPPNNKNILQKPLLNLKLIYILCWGVIYQDFSVGTTHCKEFNSPPLFWFNLFGVKGRGITTLRTINVMYYRFACVPSSKYRKTSFALKLFSFFRSYFVVSYYRVNDSSADQMAAIRMSVKAIKLTHCGNHYQTKSSRT